MYYDSNGYNGIGDCSPPNQADNDKQKTIIEDETYYFRGITEGY